MAKIYDYYSTWVGNNNIYNNNYSCKVFTKKYLTID